MHTLQRRTDIVERRHPYPEKQTHPGTETLVRQKTLSEPATEEQSKGGSP